MSKKQITTDDAATAEESTAISMIRAEMDALNVKKLTRINVDVMSTVARLRSALPRLMALAPSITREAPAFKMHHLTNFDLYLKAMSEAEAAWLMSKVKNKEPSLLRTEALSLRAQLMSDVKTLIARGLVSKDAIREVKGRHGYGAVAHDLMILSTIIQSAWPSIEGKCAVTLSELGRTCEVVRALTGVAHNRRLPLEAERLAALERQRVFTLFFASYTEVRRTVQYVRFYEKDADFFVPSITGMRKGAPRKAKAAAIENPISPPLPAEPVLSQSAMESLKSDPQTESKKPAIGMPGADPFLH